MLKYIYPSALTVFIILSSLPSASLATTEYAAQTGFQCGHCHVDETGGSKLTSAGEAFVNEMKAKGLYRPLSNTQKAVRFLVGYIHLLIAVAWFGTILYVHLILKPAYAASGLPKGELFLGWFSIIIISVTGVLLSIARIPSWDLLYTTRFGMLLSIKIFLFSLMVATALTVTFYIGPRLKRKWRARWEADMLQGKQDLTVEELHGFDGKEGRPAYIAYNGRIFNVTESKIWKDGSHAKKHLSGHDLSDALKKAPHGEELILKMPEIGKLIEAGTKIPRPFPERIFYFLAYTNLVFVFLIIFVIALWRWW